MTVIDIVIDSHLGHQAQADSPPYAGNQRLTPVKRDGWGLRTTVCVSETLKTTIFKVAGNIPDTSCQIFSCELQPQITRLKLNKGSFMSRHRRERQEAGFHFIFGRLS